MEPIKKEKYLMLPALPLPGASATRQTVTPNSRRTEFPGIPVGSTAKHRGIPYRLTKLPMSSVFRAMTISETRGFMKALIDTESDRILGFTMFGASAGEVMTTVQMTMLAGSPSTALRDAIITHPTMSEGLVPLLLAVPGKTSLSASRKGLKLATLMTAASNPSRS